MRTSIDRTSTRNAARIAVAVVALLGAVHGALASGDGGLQQFFSSMFGDGGAAPVAAVAPAQSEVEAPRPRAIHNRPLTVRLHRAKPRVVAAQVPTKPGKISIFQDRTLRRGDAVMMADGIRIFAGSTAWPYTSGDFVSLSAAKELGKAGSRVLAEADRLPRG